MDHDLGYQSDLFSEIFFQVLQPFLISLKNILALAAFAASRLLKGPREARHCQGPSGIDAWVKRNRLSQKKISAFAALRLLEGPGEARHYQGPPGINAWVKRNCLSQKKISAFAAFAAFVAIGGRWRVPGRPDTVRDHQGSTLGSKGTV